LSEPSGRWDTVASNAPNRRGDDVQVSQSAVDRFLVGLLGLVLIVLVGLLIVRNTGDDGA
jgi:hypothetical protein